jgi:hypothetical protein
MSGRGSRYVAITRQEFEQFLRSIRKPFSLKSGTKGIYLIELSDNVALAVNSTIGDEVRGLGKASIQLNFVSLHPQKFHKIIYGYKKIMARVVGKKYLQRSTNWRKTLKDAIDKCIAYYDQGSTWFEKIALPDDMQQQSQPQVQQQSQQDSTQLLMRIESIPNWSSNTFLQSLHNQVSQGRTLSDKQLGAIERFEQNVRQRAPQPQVPQSAPQAQGKYQANLDSMRDLYVALRNSGASAENLEEIAEIGKSLKSKGSISGAEFEILEEICEEENVAVPNFAEITAPNPKKLASQQRVGGQWNKAQVGNNAFEIYYRGIPTGSILKVARGYEAIIMEMGRPRSLGVFKTDQQAFEKIQSEK